MKKIVIGSIMTLAMLGMNSYPSVAQAAEERVVFIDLDKAFSEFHKTKLADGQLKEQAEEFKTERKKLIDDLQTLQDAFNSTREQAQNTALNEDARAQKRDLAEEKLVEIREQESKVRRFDDSRQKQLDEQSRRMRKRIVDEMRQTIQTYAVAQGYTAVVDSSGESLNGVPMFLYTDPKSDITETVIQMLNANTESEPEK